MMWPVLLLSILLMAGGAQAATSPGWILLFRQTTPFYYSSANSWAQAKSHNVGDPTNPNYSILDQLEGMREAAEARDR